MLAFAGLSPMELLLVLFGVVVGIVLTVRFLARLGNAHTAALEKENQRLLEEINQRRGRDPGHG